LMMGSPMGHSLEMSDKYQYSMLSTTMGRGWSSEWQGFKEHEYVNRPMMSRRPERTSHHLKLDHQNEYIRLKTRAGKGSSPIRGVDVQLGNRDINQGFEARDGNNGDGAWVELVDSQHRGLWMSRKENLLILRGKKRKSLYIWFNDRTREVSIYNGEGGGRVNVYSAGSVDIRAANNLNLESGGNINLRANEIRMNSNSGGSLAVASNVFFSPRLLESARTASGARIPSVPKIEPQDRGQTYNGPFEGIERSELEYRIELDGE